MFAQIDLKHSYHNTASFLRGVAWLLGLRRHRRQVVFRIPPSAR